MSELTAGQEASLSQVLELAEDCDREVAISVLSSVDWDVQRAADMIFGGSGGGSSSAPLLPRPSAPIETFDIDDSEQGGRPAAGQQQGAPFSMLIVRPLLSVLSFPIHLLSSLLRFMFGVLRIPFPALRFSGLNFYSPLRPRPPSRQGGPDRWLRELEEETGAVSIARLKAPKGVSSSAAGPSSSAAASSSHLTSRGNAAAGLNGITVEEGRKLLPDFTLSTYEEVLRTVQRDSKIACVILVSEEHDDAAEFKRHVAYLMSTLTDLSFVRALHNNDIVVWGGDVRDKEAWGAAEKLQATTYPFVAFLALQPRRNIGSRSSSTSSPPSLTVLSRHQGPPTPSTSGPTSAHTLVTHIETQVLPRVSSYLNRLKSIQRERELERQLREDQDRAFASAAQRDKERIQAKMAEAQRAAEAQRLLELERAREVERQQAEAERLRREEELRMDWRRWTRRHFSSTAEASGKGAGLRFAIRLPNGERVIHQFSLKDDDLTNLYAFVDSKLIPSEYPASEDPLYPPSSPSSSAKQTLQSHILQTQSTASYWGFVIATSFPRVEVPWKESTPLSSVQHLKGGGQLVVELISSRTNSPRPSLSSTASSSANGSGSGEDSDDGYETED
ncbi:hypothetical protein MD484_g942, partial [Candolleomyces efflorescens]